MECNKFRFEYYFFEVFFVVIKIFLYCNYLICFNEMCSCYLINLEVKGIFIKGVNVIMILGYKEELLF